MTRPVNQDGEHDEEDRFASPPGLWLPKTVVKKHRRNATIIWVSLLVGFLAYVAYIIWESIDSRKDPASRIELKQEYYTFPDVALCSEFGQGCLDVDNDCFVDGIDNLIMWNHEGFTGNYQSFPDQHRDVREAFEAAYPACVYVPLSRLNVDTEGVSNGTITSLSASFLVLWVEGGENYDHSYYLVEQQFLDMYLLEADAPLESFEGRSVDAKVPYARLNITTNNIFEARANHMVLGLTEFVAINKHGKREKKQRSFTQTTTTGIESWWWDTGGYSSVEVSILIVEMSIRKFEFTSIEEVDPVEIWSIIGAIGGIWQCAVTGFGLFFVFSEKQPPDRKMRNFRKSVAKPAIVINRRLSSASSRGSNQSSRSGDSTALPPGWRSRTDESGRPYYLNTVAKTTQWDHPMQSVLSTGSSNGRLSADQASLTRARRTDSSSTRPQYSCSPGDPGHHRSGGAADIAASHPVGYAPPPPLGDVAAVPSYRTMVHLPNTSAAVPASGSGDDGGVHPQRQDGERQAHASRSSAVAGAGGRRATTAGVRAGIPLPPNWEMKVAPVYKPYYVNSVTKATQWEAPHA